MDLIKFRMDLKDLSWTTEKASCGLDNAYMGRKWPLRDLKRSQIDLIRPHMNLMRSYMDLKMRLMDLNRTLIGLKRSYMDLKGPPPVDLIKSQNVSKEAYST